MGLFDIFRSPAKPNAPSPVAREVPIVDNPNASPEVPPAASANSEEPFLGFKYSFKKIGKTSAECPYCNTSLDKFHRDEPRKGVRRCLSRKRYHGAARCKSQLQWN